MTTETTGGAAPANDAGAAAAAAAASGTTEGQAPGQTEGDAGAAAAAAAAAAAEGGELILGKFKTQADLEAGYKSLETKLGAKTGDAPAPVDLAAFSTEFAEKGELTAESMTALTDLLSPLGISKDIIQQYVDGAKHTKTAAEAAEAAAWEPYGGEEGAQAMVDWAMDVLPEAEFNRYKGALGGEDQEKALLALDAIKVRYDNAMSGAAPKRPGALQPKLVSGGGGAGAKTGPFATAAEQSAAINDPRYRSDPEYRNAVIERMTAS